MKKSISKNKTKKRSNIKKSNTSKLLIFIKKYKLYFFILTFMILGTITLILSRAATISNVFESEDSQFTGCVSTVIDSTASGGKASSIGCQVKITNGFTHPGILEDKAQLDFVKDKIKNSQQPWKAAYDNMASSRMASLSYTPHPVSVVKCIAGGGTSTTYPTAGCSEQIDDATASYTQALMWYYTGNDAYAKKSIEIMNAWSYKLTDILFDQPRDANNNIIYANGKLQAGWSAETMSRGAEIIRYTYSGWPSKDITQLENNFKNVHYRLVKDGWTAGGNWETTFSDAMVNIGIFTNDRTIFENGVNYWRQVIPSLIYLNKDGALPIPPPGNVYKTASQINKIWWYPSSYLNGQSEETCRDMGHTMMGFGGMTNAAESARIQGIDLYGEQKDRFIAGFELNSNYINQLEDQMKATGQSASQVTASSWKPSGTWVCPGFKDGGGSAYLGSEIMYNHFANRLGLNLPNTKKLAERNRPSKSGNHLHWETLTHANTGGATTLKTSTIKNTISVPQYGTYRIWARIKAPDNNFNSISLKVDSNAPIKIGDFPIAANSWTWVDYIDANQSSKTDILLAQGDHTVEIYGLEPGVILDKIIIANSNCIPTSMGDNCKILPNSAPIVNLTSPTNSSVYNAPANINISADATDNDGTISKVEFYNGQTKIGEDLTAPYTFNWNNVGTGTYQISAKAIDNNNAVTSSSASNITINTSSSSLSNNLTAINDTYINSGTPDSNFATSPALYATANANIAFMRFDTLNFVQPTGKTLNKVTLRLYTNNNSSTIGGYEIHRSTVSWGSTTLTWNNQGAAFSPEILALSSTPVTGKWLDIPLPLNAVTFTGTTKFGVKYTVSGSGTNFGSTDSSNKPQLILEYK